MSFASDRWSQNVDETTNVRYKKVHGKNAVSEECRAPSRLSGHEST